MAMNLSKEELVRLGRNLSELSNQFSTVREYTNHYNPFIGKLVESITYNPQSQNVIIQLRDLLIRESDQIKGGNVLSDLDAEEALKRLSERYRESYPQFLNCYNQWKPKRKELIRTSKASADQIDLNFNLVSTFRIITSTADIIGTQELFRAQASSLSSFAFNNASIFGVLSLFMEKIASKRYYSKVKNIITEDQKMFEELTKWFKQTEELDRAVKTYFPYGIDKDLVRVIDKAPTMTDLYNKLFVSIVASNVRNDVHLFTNRHFLDKAENFATSEAGIQWFNKVILEDDPIVNECMKIGLTSEISTIMNIPMQNPDVLVGASALLSTKKNFKMLLNGMTIFSAVSNLWNDTKSEESYALRKLAKRANIELNAIKRVLKLLKPSDIDIGDALQ